MDKVKKDRSLAPLTKRTFLALVIVLVIYFSYNFVLALKLDKNKVIEVWRQLMSGQYLPNKEQKGKYIFLIIRNILDLLTTSVLGGYVFALIICRKPKIILADQIVLRLSPQGAKQDEGRYCIGVFAGNKSRSDYYDLSCGITCVCTKENTTDGEPHKLTEDVADKTLHVMEQMYRFPFDTELIPIEFWRHHFEILNEDGDARKNIAETYASECLKVVLSGSSGYLGGEFTVIKKYSHKDIFISNKIPNVAFELDKNNKKKLQWNERLTQHSKSRRDNKKTIYWNRFRSYGKYVTEEENISPEDRKKILCRIEKQAEEKRKTPKNPALRLPDCLATRLDAFRRSKTGKKS